MDEKEIFENGCFLPDWTTDDAEDMTVSQVYIRQNKDLQTLLSELDEIKDRIQEIQARQWRLAKMINFHENQLAKE